MATYKLSPEAEDDLYRIWVYGAEKFGIEQADLYFAAFFHQFDLIARNPFLYPSVDYIRKGYRRAVSGVDSIYYRVVGDFVEIMAIIGRQILKADFQSSNKRRILGPPKGMSESAKQKALVAEEYHMVGKMSVSDILDKLQISRGTYYKYLRYREITPRIYRPRKK